MIFLKYFSVKNQFSFALLAMTSSPPLPAWYHPFDTTTCAMCGTVGTTKWLHGSSMICGSCARHGKRKTTVRCSTCPGKTLPDTPVAMVKGKIVCSGCRLYFSLVDYGATVYGQMSNSDVKELRDRAATTLEYFLGSVEKSRAEFVIGGDVSDHTISLFGKCQEMETEALMEM